MNSPTDLLNLYINKVDIKAANKVKYLSAKI